MTGGVDELKLDGPFDAVTLFMNCWKPRKNPNSMEEIDSVWLDKINGSSACKERRTPSKPLDLQHLWSPSMETPKTGVSSIDARLKEVSVTSPTLLFGNSAGMATLTDEDEDDLPMTNLPTAIGLEYPNNNAAQTSIGFTTATGKRIRSPSKEAIERSKILVLSENTHENIQCNTPALMGFTTGSGKLLAQPKEASLIKARSIIEDLEDDLTVSALVRIKATVEKGEAGNILWKTAFKCAPCRDIDISLLSGVYLHLVI